MDRIGGLDSLDGKASEAFPDRWKVIKRQYKAPLKSLQRNRQRLEIGAAKHPIPVVRSFPQYGGSR